MDASPATLGLLGRLREAGVDLAIDEFGAEYSSLNYLKRFPIDALKVDRSFVNGLGRDLEDSAIVAAVVSLAHTLGLSAVAEGIETEGPTPAAAPHRLRLGPRQLLRPRAIR